MIRCLKKVFRDETCRSRQILLGPSRWILAASGVDRRKKKLGYGRGFDPSSPYEQLPKDGLKRKGTDDGIEVGKG